MEDNRRKTIENHKLKPKDLAQLSMILIMILHALATYSKPIIRHSLLQEINEYLKKKCPSEAQASYQDTLRVPINSFF